MRPYQRQFIDFALSQGALRFGHFVLKSGRESPYFFNSGLFDSGASLARLGQFYAEAIIASGIDFDMLYGAAYKGIPLVAATAIALYGSRDRDYPYCFNRKEAKDHGELGQLVGAAPQGRVLVVDDVVSAGTSVHESLALIHDAGASVVGVAVALDRQERGSGDLSAIEEVKRDLGIDVTAIIKLNQLVAYLEDASKTTEEKTQLLKRVRDYRASYGAGP